MFEHGSERSDAGEISPVDEAGNPWFVPAAMDCEIRMMNSADNKQLIAQAFDGLARADAADFLDLMAEDFAWIVEGQSKWSRRFDGKEAVRRDLMIPLFANFATPYRTVADEIIAEGDRVVVLCRGEVRTKSGKDYNNSYCFVIRMRGGKMVELREYMDTALAEAVLDLPAGAGASGG